MYSIISKTEPIRQGDIFRWLPKFNVVLGDASLPLITEFDKNGEKEVDWFQFAKSPYSESISPENLIKTISVTVKPAIGIVISQDCDASLCENVVFAEIKPINEFGAFRDFKDPPPANKVIKLVTEYTRKNQKWYFLNDSLDLGFDKKMGADFESIFEIKREMLVKHIELLRIGRLDDEVAWPHFRERVAEFFRRYPYNEWYPLNPDEVNVYEENQKRSNPDFVLEPKYRWQNP